jgi:hypothetical protein
MTAEEKQNLGTPADLWRVLHAEFCFDVDVCATAETRKVPMYFGPDHEIAACRDALSRSVEWIPGGSEQISAYCNPPFRDVMRWHVKAHAEAQKHPNAVVVVLGLPGGSQEWFRFAYRHAAEIRLMTPRVQFDVPEGCQRFTNTRDSVLYVYRRNPHQPHAHVWPWNWKGDLFRSPQQQEITDAG